MSGKCKMKPIFDSEKFLSIIFNDAELDVLHVLCCTRHGVLNMLEDLAADTIEVMCRPDIYPFAIMDTLSNEFLQVVVHEIRYNYSSAYVNLANCLMPYDNILHTIRFWAIFIHCLPVPQDFILK